MPVPSAIAISAVNYNMNADFLKKNVEGLTDEEWLRRPEGAANHILWIVGHLCWVRGMLLKRLGEDWSKPWFAHFGRGSKLDESAAYPTPEEARLAWDESIARLNAVLESASSDTDSRLAWDESISRLNAVLESVSEEALAAPSTQGPPSPDGKVSGVVNFLALHETYHIGQISYLRSWLGHAGVMG